jgi:hypothetical protein
MKYSRLLFSTLLLGACLVIVGYAAPTKKPTQAPSQATSIKSKPETIKPSAEKEKKQSSLPVDKEPRQVGDNTGLTNRVEAELQTW